jgi:hypothetical protein
MISCASATFLDHKEFGNFADACAVAAGIAKYVGYWPGAFFALALYGWRDHRSIGSRAFDRLCDW